MPLTVPLYYSRGSEKHVERLKGRGQAGPCMVPAGPCLLALTIGMLPPCSSPLAWPRQHAGLVSGPPATPCTAPVWFTLSHPAPHHPPTLSLCNATLTSVLISMRCEKSHLLVQMWGEMANVYWKHKTGSTSSLQLLTYICTCRCICFTSIFFIVL